MEERNSTAIRHYTTIRKHTVLAGLYVDCENWEVEDQGGRKLRQG